MHIPDVIKINPEDFNKKKAGRPTTEVYRRNHRKELAKAGKAIGQRASYSDKEKMNAACSFAVCGNSRRVAEITGVPEGTIRAWKTTEWWEEIQSRIIKEQDEELDTKLTKLVDKAVAEVNDRLEDGDYVYNSKLDKLIRKPINAKDLAVVAAITVDKRQLLRGQPTSRTENISQESTLKKLADEFKRFAVAKEVVQDTSLEEKDVLTIDHS